MRVALARTPSQISEAAIALTYPTLTSASGKFKEAIGDNGNDATIDLTEFGGGTIVVENTLANDFVGRDFFF